MKEISTLKVGAVMLVMGLFLPILPSLTMLLAILPISFINAVGFFSILHVIFGLQFLVMYIPIVGFLLLLINHFTKDNKDGKVYRFVDHMLAGYFIFMCLGGLLFIFLIRSTDNLPAHYIGFMSYLSFARIVFINGFAILWGYGLSFGKSGIALTSSLCFIIIASSPLLPYNNPELARQIDMQHYQQHSSISEDKTSLESETGEVDIAENENAIQENIDVNTVNLLESGKSWNLLLLAYTWLRFGRHLFPQPQLKREQPETA